MLFRLIFFQGSNFQAFSEHLKFFGFYLGGIGKEFEKEVYWLGSYCFPS